MNIYIAAFLIILFFNIIRGKKSLHILQLNQYNENNKYLSWILANVKEVFLSFDLLAVVTIFIAYILDNNISKILVTIAIIFYLLDAIRILNKKKIISSKKFIITKRIKRLIVTMSIVLMLPVILYIVDRDNILLMVFIESIITYLSYIVILIVNMINMPIEKLIYKYDETKAKEILKNVPNLNVISVIGTSGKTALKNLLNEIIINTNKSSKVTPKHLNTIHGLILTINNVIKENDDFFIAELSTDNISDINSINSILNSKCVVLTTTDTTYLEKIKNPLNVIKNKFDFINSLPSDGVAILNKDDTRQASYHFSGKCKKIWIGIDNKDADIYATSIKYDSNGSKFKIVFKESNDSYSFETKILGNYNIYNILSSVALLRYFGMDIKEIIKAVKMINPSKSRLGIKNCGYMYQINDFYNPTPREIKASLDVLSKMPGTKVVVTKGITELPERVKSLNYTFGIKIAEVADYVILLNAKGSKQIFEGLIESEYNKNRIYVVNNLKEAYNLLQSINEKSIYALFENVSQDDIMNKE